MRQILNNEIEKVLPGVLQLALFGVFELITPKRSQVDEKMKIHKNIHFVGNMIVTKSSASVTF